MIGGSVGVAWIVWRCGVGRRVFERDMSAMLGDCLNCGKVMLGCNVCRASSGVGASECGAVCGGGLQYQQHLKQNNNISEHSILKQIKPPP